MVKTSHTHTHTHTYISLLSNMHTTYCFKTFKEIQYEVEKEERIKKKKKSLRNLWENFKYINIHTMKISRQKKEKSAEKIVE